MIKFRCRNSEHIILIISNWYTCMRDEWNTNHLIICTLEVNCKQRVITGYVQLKKQRTKQILMYGRQHIQYLKVQPFLTEFLRKRHNGETLQKFSRFDQRNLALSGEYVSWCQTMKSGHRYQDHHVVLAKHTCTSIWRSHSLRDSYSL